MAFAERLWTYLPFTLEAPLLIPRNDPFADTLLLEVSSDLATPVNTESDLSLLNDLSQFSVDVNGNTTIIP